MQVGRSGVKKQGFTMRADDVASTICQALILGRGLHAAPFVMMRFAGMGLCLKAIYDTL